MAPATATATAAPVVIVVVVAKMAPAAGMKVAVQDAPHRQVVEALDDARLPSHHPGHIATHTVLVDRRPVVPAAVADVLRFPLYSQLIHN